jgi:hypothetical protein
MLSEMVQESGIVVHACNPSLQVVKAGRLSGRQAGLQSKFEARLGHRNYSGKMHYY